MVKKNIVIGLLLLVLISSCTKSNFLSKKEVEAVTEKVINDESKSSATPPVECGTGTQLQSGKCVIVNNGNDGSFFPTPTLPPSQLTPPPTTNIICREPSGVFTSLYYRQRNFVSGLLCGEACKAQILGTFRYQGNCPADIYIESGIPNAPRSVNALELAPSGFFNPIKGQPSACDGNVHFNGIIVKQMQPNQVVSFKLTPENYGVEGTYPIGIGVFTGCFKDGGVQIQGYPTQLVGFSNNYERSTLTNKDIELSWVSLVRP